jgi:hypothetical protein
LAALLEAAYTKVAVAAVATMTEAADHAVTGGNGRSDGHQLQQSSDGLSQNSDNSAAICSYQRQKLASASPELTSSLRCVLG